MDNFWTQVAATAAGGEPALLATVMAVSGGVHAPPGARLLVTATATAGGLDGGPADSIVVPQLRRALGGLAFAEHIIVDQATAQSQGLLQGGAIELLVQPLTDFGPEMLDAIAEVINAGGSLLIATPLVPEGEVVSPGLPAIIRDGAVSGVPPAGILARAESYLQQGLPLTQRDSDGVAFIDVVRPGDELIILGATLMAEELSQLAARAGFRVTVIDPNPAVRDRYPAASEIVITDDPLGAVTASRILTPSTYIVSMTVGHRFDLGVVQELLRRPLRYLGMMGSRGRVAKVQETLRENGFTDEEIGRLYAPLGLNLNAETPFEIAVSIMAQLIQVRRGQTGLPSDWSMPPVAAVR